MPALQGLESVLAQADITPEAVMSYMSFLVGLGEASTLMEENKFGLALGKLRDTLVTCLGGQRAYKMPLLPREGVQSELYIKMDPKLQVFAMRCCTLFAECYYKMGNHFDALYWLAEAQVIHRNTYFNRAEGASFDWMDWFYSTQMMYDAKFYTYKLESDIYLELGNTGTAMHRVWQGYERVTERIDQLRPPGISSKHLKKDALSWRNYDLTKIRHPDPARVGSLEIKDARLQVLGSWRRIILPKGRTIGARKGFCGFVWNRRYYVFGGEKSPVTGPWYRDFHYLDLTDIQAGWHKLPDYPLPVPRELRLCNYAMQVDTRTDRAYFYHGGAELDVFDLRAGAWLETMSTRMAESEGAFPVDNTYTDFACAVVAGKLYVFGGSLSEWMLGGNMLACLDLDTCEWTRLSGWPDARIQPDLRQPGPRRYPVMWADEDKEKLWVMFGEADRVAAKDRGQMRYASHESFVQADCWSWDIRRREWREERIVGNAPSPRAETAVVNNTNLGKVMLFGGYNAAVRTRFAEEGKHFSFTYYADTFMLDTASEPPSWRHVLTSGFPTYRAQSQLFCDPATGATYLFGGYTNAECLPNRPGVQTRYFGDLWQLRLDVPGGGFEIVDVEEERWTERVGPWMRCFGCGNAGLGAGLKKCAGTCKGKVSFCDAECQRSGWKDHKAKHGCTRG